MRRPCRKLAKGWPSEALCCAYLQGKNSAAELSITIAWITSKSSHI